MEKIANGYQPSHGSSEETKTGNNKSSTTSSIRVGSTIGKPDTKSLVHGIATIIESQMREDSNLGKQIMPTSDLYFFCEDKYVSDPPESVDEERFALMHKPPSVNNIYEFMLAMYDCAQFR
jgi:hypothetical protein